MIINKKNFVNRDKQMELYGIKINGVSSDSRQIKDGYLFGALDSEKATADAYIPSAVANGAKIVVCKPSYADSQRYPDVKFITDENPNLKFAQLAADFYGEQPNNICAVTGTNGKTSIADFVRQILTLMGENAASIGTIGLIKGFNKPIPSANTTPNAVVLAQELSELKKDGYDFAIMEMSSHGLCQYRVGGVKNVKVAGFTNLTRDHLDYHKTFENYLAAKEILFREILVEGGTAVLNADIEVFERLNTLCLSTKKNVISYGHNGKELKLIKSTPTLDGQILDILYFGEKKQINIPLAGEFQAMNVLCALGMAALISGKRDEVLKYVSHIHGAKGRLDLAGKTPNGAAIYVDYAHTPDALENVLLAMRSHTKGKLHVLFGCGGDRDAGKRPIMGKIANDLADVIYVTDDNPRTENAEKIRQQIMQACPRGKNIAGRAEAIAEAIKNLEKDDVLILAGKGHETGQYINGVVYPFSDYDEVEKNLIK